MTGPLDGLFVVDTSWGSPGAISSLLFADYGATVVKVERPDAPPLIDPISRKAWERGKLSVHLDLRSADGRAALDALIQRADVLIESAAGDAAQLGLDRARTEDLNPRLVHASITPYGREGPWTDRPGWEALVAARMGFMAEQPGHRPSPVFLGHPSISYTTGFLTTIGSLAALRARHRTGRGQQVDVSMLDGVLGQAPMNWWFTSTDESYLDTEERGHFGHRRVLIDIFECRDGEYLMIHCGGQGSFKAAMEVLGVGDEFRTVTDAVEMSVPLDEHEFHVARKVVPTLWGQRDRDEWVELLNDRDVAVVPVLRPGEVLDHEQVRHADMVVELEDADFGKIRQSAPGVRFSKTPVATPTPAPQPGEHTSQLDELVAGASPIAETATPEPDLAHALEGVKILDFSQFMAAAYGAKYLGDLGAEVIKIEPPIGDTMRSLPDPFEACQRGKRAIVLDLTTDSGKEAMRRLVAEADIVVHNMRPGKAENLGIGYEDLKAVKEDLIYCYQPGWGSTGPSVMRKSFAPLMSALTGLMFVAAGDGNPPVRRARASEDYYGGFLGACGMLMALEHRNQTGEGQYVESPQLHSSLFAVTEQMTDGDGASIHGPTLDSDQRGYTPLYRLYPTKDDWVAVAAVGSEAVRRLAGALDLAELSTMPSDDEIDSIETALEARAGQLTAAELAEFLDAAGIANEIARDRPYMPDFFWEEWALESGHVFEHFEHADWEYIREVGLTIRLSETPGLQRGPGPLLGEHDDEVFAELDYDPRVGDRS